MVRKKREPTSDSLPQLSAGSSIELQEATLATLDPSLSDEAMLHWLAVQLNRAPEPFDYYNVGKGLYDRGMYKSSAVFLQAYVDTSNSLMPGRHLLGYAHANLNNAKKASEQLRSCVEAGFDTDWQVLVEMECDLLEKEILTSNVQASIENSLRSSNIDDVFELNARGGTPAESTPPEVAPSPSPPLTKPKLWEFFEKKEEDDELVRTEQFVLD